MKELQRRKGPPTALPTILPSTSFLRLGLTKSSVRFIPFSGFIWMILLHNDAMYLPRLLLCASLFPSLFLSLLNQIAL